MSSSAAMGRSTPRPPSRRTRVLLPTLIIIGVLLVAFGIFTNFWTERLWYRSEGYGDVFATQLATRALLFVLFGLVMGLAVGLNAYIAYRLRPMHRVSSAEQQSLDRYRDAIDPIRKWVVIGASVLFGLLAGGSASAQWRTFLQWRNSSSFGVDDPQFGVDVSFFAFDYPWWRFVLSFGFAAVVLGALAAVVTHYIYGGIRLQSAGERVTGSAQAHLSVLIGLFVLLKAVAYWLDRYGMVIAEGFANGRTGAGYTDIQAQLPSRTILTFIALICALLFFANVWRRSWMLPGMGLGLLVLSAVLLGGVWPLIVQQFQVSPNEADRESPYIARNLDATRAAYDIDDVQTTVYPATTQVTAGQLAADTETVPGIRLIDPNIVPPTFEAQQQVRGFYSMADTLDVDRYEVDGLRRDMVIGTRELDVQGIPERNWINEHTVYTHGYGVVAAYGNQRATDGSPVYAERDIPPTGVLGEYEPRIYFGETSPAYSVVGAPEDADPVEFDIPEDVQTTQQRQNTYEGASGVPIGSLFNKLLYAMKYQEGNILLSDRVNDESKILYHRDPRERLEKVAPWLHVDRNAYPAVVDGKVLWILDGYTSLDTYPYAQRIDLEEATADSRTISPTSVAATRSETVNYYRNSVKATVDAYDGTVNIYAWDGDDPVLQTWSKAFGGTVQSREDIPDELLDHLRYPEDMFKVQRGLLAEYHVENPRDFYGGQDFWEVPTDPTSSTGRFQPPYFLSLRMPDQDSAAFSLTSTYVPRNRQNLASFMAVNADARSDEFGTIRILRLPGTTQIDGPGQMANEFESDQQVTQATLPLRQGDANTREGNLLTLPVGGGLLYIQPIYVERTGTTATFPLLRLVLVSFGEEIGVADTLQGALDQIFEGDAGAGTGEQPPPETGEPTEPVPPTTPGTTPPPDVQAALDEANAAFDEATAALQAGDLAGYAEAVERANEAVDRALELLAGQSAGAASPSPSPSP